jgi:hypothetical protein
MGILKKSLLILLTLSLLLKKSTLELLVLVLFLSSGILETRKHNVSELDLFPLSGEGGGKNLLCWVP